MGRLKSYEEKYIMKLIYSNNAKRFIKKLNDPNKSRIRQAIENLPNGDIKKMKGSNQLYRLRIGDYRIIFTKTNTIYEIKKIHKWYL